MITNITSGCMGWCSPGGVRNPLLRKTGSLLVQMFGAWLPGANLPSSKPRSAAVPGCFRWEPCGLGWCHHHPEDSHHHLLPAPWTTVGSAPAETVSWHFLMSPCISSSRFVSEVIQHLWVSQFSMGSNGWISGRRFQAPHCRQPQAFQVKTPKNHEKTSLLGQFPIYESLAMKPQPSIWSQTRWPCHRSSRSCGHSSAVRAASRARGPRCRRPPRARRWNSFRRSRPRSPHGECGRWARGGATCSCRPNLLGDADAGSENGVNHG